LEPGFSPSARQSVESGGSLGLNVLASMFPGPMAGSSFLRVVSERGTATLRPDFLARGTARFARPPRIRLAELVTAKPPRDFSSRTSRASGHSHQTILPARNQKWGRQPMRRHTEGLRLTRPLQSPATSQRGSTVGSTISSSGSPQPQGQRMPTHQSSSSSRTSTRSYRGSPSPLMMRSLRRGESQRPASTEATGRATRRHRRHHAEATARTMSPLPHQIAATS